MATNETSDLDVAEGIAKRVHGKVQDLLPRKGLKLLNKVPFDDANGLGLEFSEQIWLTGEHGFTYGGTGSAKVTLNESEVATSQLSQLLPASIHFRSEISIGAMSRARAKGEKAFENIVESMMRNSKAAFDKRLEWSMRYGGDSLATLDSAVDGGTTITMTIDRDTWASGPWVGSRNMAIDAYESSTKLNTNADLVVSTISVNPAADSRTVVATGSAADIDAILNSGSSGSGVELYFKGQYGNDATGLRTVANLTTGTYLNISADTYKDVWNGTQYSWSPQYNSGGVDFSWSLLQKGLEEACDRGLDGDICLEVPPHVWSTLNSSLDALRTFDSSYSVNKVEMGHDRDAITYHGVTGKVTVYVSRFIKDGDVIWYPDPSEDADSFVKAARIGSTNVTFEYPGRGGQMFKAKEDETSCEWRAFSDQNFYLPAPRQCGIFT